LCIIEEGKASGSNRLGRFADEWRGGYMPSMAKARSGEMPWTNLNHLHRTLLEDLLEEFQVEGFR